MVRSFATGGQHFAAATSSAPHKGSLVFQVAILVTKFGSWTPREDTLSAGGFEETRVSQIDAFGNPMYLQNLRVGVV